MNNIFLSHQMLGKLRLVNIYEYYQVPRLFSVENEVGSFYAIYWIGDDHNYDNWFVIPISKLRLNRLENRNIDIRDLLVNQEQGNFFCVRKPYDDGMECVVEILEKSAIEGIILPKSGVFISEVTPAGLKASNASELLTATHEIRVSKTNEKSSKTPSLEHVTRVFDSFGTIYKSFLDAVNLHGAIEPIGARPGSFILSFQAEHLAEFENQLIFLNKLIILRKDLKDFLKESSIDIRGLATLMSSVIETSTTFELKNNATAEIIITIRKTDAAFYLADINKASITHLTSYQIPQANDLEKLFLLVEMIWQGKEVNSLTLKVKQRHVAYYKHAAKILGFFESNGAITALGQQLAEADIKKRLGITIRCFESSYCGWAWVVWSNVKNITDVNSNTAELFLRETCSNLSESTAKRRASCLSTWLDELKDSYVF
ncbi:hypothetical protein NFJ01_10575 [Lelliottia amnigena]|uniref:DUF6575 domain-containing protein n=1 Tax=Lelliottia amnigena TaxID=61646 RepID=UPI00209111FA|nr:DUF6575 domain-containing protein [Lelliottia amnigena]USR62776.1 hypothetical protein NFJ01_10575 [Lelliottia amnigena]